MPQVQFTNLLRFLVASVSLVVLSTPAFGQVAGGYQTFEPAGTPQPFSAPPAAVQVAPNPTAAGQQPFANPVGGNGTIAAPQQGGRFSTTPLPQRQAVQAPASQFAMPPGQVASVPTSQPLPPSEIAAEQGNTEIEDAADTATPDKPTELGDKIAKEAEVAKNKLYAAVFQNNRRAQLEIGQKYLLPIVAIFGVMVGATWLGNRLRDRVGDAVSRRVDVTLGRFAGTLTRVTVILGTLLGVLSYFGVELTSLAALVAAIGFAVGMALQGTLGNFASGIALLVFRPFNVGDFIVADGSSGTVQAIELFTTTIDTPDNRRIIIPNESVFGHKIENWSHNQQRRVQVSVGVSYAADMKQTRQLLTDALAGIEGALPTPAPSVHLSELNASSVDWLCRVWCRTEDFFAVKEAVTEAVKETLDRHDISIPFPQLDLHVVTPTAPTRAKAA